MFILNFMANPMLYHGHYKFSYISLNAPPPPPPPPPKPGPPVSLFDVQYPLLTTKANKQFENKL